MNNYLSTPYLFVSLNHVGYLIALCYLFFSFINSIHLSPHWDKNLIWALLYNLNFKVSLKLGDVVASINKKLINKFFSNFKTL